MERTMDFFIYNSLRMCKIWIALKSNISLGRKKLLKILSIYFLLCRFINNLSGSIPEVIASTLSVEVNKRIVINALKTKKI